MLKTGRQLITKAKKKKTQNAESLFLITIVLSTHKLTIRICIAFRKSFLKKCKKWESFKVNFVLLDIS